MARKSSVLLMNATVSGLAFTEIWEYVFLLRQRCWLEQPRWCSYALIVARPPRACCDSDARLLRDPCCLGLATFAVRRARHPAASVAGIYRCCETAAAGLCVVATVLFAAGGFQLWMTVAQAREKGMVSPVAGTENWNDTARLLNWISRETPQDATLTGNLDPMYYLFTGRRAVRAFTTDPYLLYYDLGHRTGSPAGTVDGFRIGCSR